MTLNRLFRVDEIRYTWFGMYMHNVGYMYVVVDNFDNDRIVYSELESEGWESEGWASQEADIKSIAKEFNNDYLKYNELLHHYVISDNKQLTIPVLE